MATVIAVSCRRTGDRTQFTVGPVKHYELPQICECTAFSGDAQMQRGAELHDASVSATAPLLHGRRRQELTTALMDKNLTGAERAAKLRELQAVLDEQKTDAEKAQTVTLGELQDRPGIKPYEAPKGVEYLFDPQQEGEVLLCLSDHHVAPDLIREMYEDFAGRMPGFGGEATTQEQIDNWKTRFGKRLPAGMADKLIKWWVATEKSNRGA